MNKNIAKKAKSVEKNESCNITESKANIRLKLDDIPEKDEEQLMSPTNNIS